MNAKNTCCSSAKPRNDEPHEAVPDASERVYMGLPHERYLRPRLYVAAALALPVLALSMGEMIAPWAFSWLPPALNGWLQFALTTPIFFWAGAPFIRRWWHSIRERRHRCGVFLQCGEPALRTLFSRSIERWDAQRTRTRDGHGGHNGHDAPALL